MIFFEIEELRINNNFCKCNWSPDTHIHKRACRCNSYLNEMIVYNKYWYRYLQIKVVSANVSWIKMIMLLLQHLMSLLMIHILLLFIIIPGSLCYIGSAKVHSFVWDRLRRLCKVNTKQPTQHCSMYELNSSLVFSQM